VGVGDNVTENAVDVVALAASTGGLEALKTILIALPKDIPAAFLVVLHRPADYHGMLAEILNRHTPLRVKEAEEGETLRNGTVFLAPPGSHLLVNAGGILSLSQSAKMHHVRPSAEPLCESVALVFGPRAIAVVLTGGGSDGSTGVRITKQAGGFVIAQDEATSQEFSMPRAAIATGCVDRVLPLGEIGAALVTLVAGRSASAIEGET
jgi:two-component system chemotaxis response regulator CheB